MWKNNQTESIGGITVNNPDQRNFDLATMLDKTGIFEPVTLELRSDFCVETRKAVRLPGTDIEAFMNVYLPGDHNEEGEFYQATIEVYFRLPSGKAASSDQERSHMARFLSMDVRTLFTEYNVTWDHGPMFIESMDIHDPRLEDLLKRLCAAFKAHV